MAATIPTTIAILQVKLSTICSSKSSDPTKLPFSKPTPLLSLQKPPKYLTLQSSSSSLAGTAIAGAIFSSLSSCNAAFAAQQIAEIAEGDNRGIALLLPIVPAITWVLFNILQPALNQINRMRSIKGVIIGVGLGGLAGLMGSPDAASGSEIAIVGDGATSDSRGQLLLFVLAPAILWVLYNILQPALNQLNRMRSNK